MVVIRYLVLRHTISIGMCMIQRSALSLLAGIVLFSACAPRPSGTDAVHQIACDEQRLADGARELVSSVDYLVLDLAQGQVVGRMDKVVVSDGKIYVGDYTSQKVFVFGMDGKMCAVLDKRGRGPGEYLQIQSFSVDAGKLYVLDQFESTVLSYDAGTLAFLDAEKAPGPAWDFAALHDGGFLFAYAPMEGNPVRDRSLQYRVTVTDGKMRVKETFFSYAEDEADAFSIAPYLSENGDTVVYGSFREDGYCLFDRSGGQLKEQVRFKFAKPVPDGDRSSLLAVMGGGYTFLASVPYQCGSCCAINLSIGGAGQLCVFDEKGERLLRQPDGSMRNVLTGIIGSAGPCLIGNWQDKSIYAYMTKNGFERAEPDEEAAILADAPFLVFYRMKE